MHISGRIWAEQIANRIFLPLPKNSCQAPVPSPTVPRLVPKMMGITPDSMTQSAPLLSPNEQESPHPSTAKTGVMSRNFIAKELLAEHFGFPTDYFIQDLIDAMYAHMYTAMIELQAYLDHEFTSTKGEYTQDELDKSMSALETLYESAFDKSFDKFELFASQNIFHIPDGLSITLAQYKDLELTSTAEDEAKLDEEIDSARREILSTQYFNSQLTRELLEFDSVKLQLEHIGDALEKYKVSTIASGNVSVAMAGLTESLEECQALSSSIHERTQHVSFLECVSAQRSEKARYLASSIASHIENNPTLQPSVLAAAENETACTTPSRVVSARSTPRRSRKSASMNDTARSKRLTLDHVDQTRSMHLAAVGSLGHEAQGMTAVATVEQVQALRDMLKQSATK